MSQEEKEFSNQHNKKIASYLKRLARIRIYVIGNCDNITNSWSKLMIENESNTPEYDEMCIFLCNEPVTPLTVHSLVHREGSSWPVKKIEPKALYDMQNESHVYLIALDRGRSNLQSREMSVNIDLCRWAMGYHDDNTKYSTEVEDINLNNYVLFRFSTLLV